MTLALTVDNTSFGAAGRVSVQVTGAGGSIPVGSPIYTSAFPATYTYDSWTGGTDSTPAAPTCTAFNGGSLLPGYVGGGVSDWSTDTQYLQRTFTGLTIGNVYRMTMEAQIFTGPSSVLVFLSVVGIGVSGTLTPLVKTGYSSFTYTFTATATSHVVQMRRTTGVAAAISIRSAVLQRMSATSTTALTITRIDTNGERFVRLTQGIAPDSTGYLYVQDWEGAYTGATYRVIDSAGNVATAVAPAVVLSPGQDSAHIVAVGTTQVGFLDRVTGLDQAYEYRDSSSSLAIIGRTGPVITTRSDNQWSKRQGIVTYYAADHAAAEAIVTIYKASRVVFLRTANQEVKDLYHVASGIRVRPVQLQVSGWTYTVEVDYQEINWPDGYLAGASWTYADVLAGYLAYFDLPITYATYAALATG